MSPKVDVHTAACGRVRQHSGLYSMTTVCYTASKCKTQQEALYVYYLLVAFLKIMTGHFIKCPPCRRGTAQWTAHGSSYWILWPLVLPVRKPRHQLKQHIPSEGGNETCGGAWVPVCCHVCEPQWTSSPVAGSDHSSLGRHQTAAHETCISVWVPEPGPPTQTPDRQ